MLSHWFRWQTWRKTYSTSSRCVQSIGLVLVNLPYPRSPWSARNGLWLFQVNQSVFMSGNEIFKDICPCLNQYMGEIKMGRRQTTHRWWRKWSRRRNHNAQWYMSYRSVNCLFEFVYSITVAANFFDSKAKFIHTSIQGPMIFPAVHYLIN